MICCAGTPPAGLTGSLQPIRALPHSANRPIGARAVCSSPTPTDSRHLCWTVALTGDASSSVESTRILTDPPAAKRAPSSSARLRELSRWFSSSSVHCPSLRTIESFMYSVTRSHIIWPLDDSNGTLLIHVNEHLLQRAPWALSPEFSTLSHSKTVTWISERSTSLYSTSTMAAFCWKCLR